MEIFALIFVNKSPHIKIFKIFSCEYTGPRVSSTCMASQKSRHDWQLWNYCYWWDGPYSNMFTVDGDPVTAFGISGVTLSIHFFFQSFWCLTWIMNDWLKLYLMLSGYFPLGLNDHYSEKVGKTLQHFFHKSLFMISEILLKMQMH